MALVSGRRSVLNPDAPLFIPAAFRQVEDFSPEWWELVKTSTWFRDYWISEHQEEKFDGDDANADDEYDIENLLPESFDISIDEEFPNPEAQLDELVQSCVFEVENGSAPFALMKDTPRNGVEMDMNKAMMEKLLMVQSSKERGPKSPVEPARYHEKPAQCVSPKCCSPRRIQQPR